MKLNYSGSLSHFQQITRDCGGRGGWKRLVPVGGYQFRSLSGEIIYWWPSTGTFFFQGRPGPLQRSLIAVFVREADVTRHR